MFFHRELLRKLTKASNEASYHQLFPLSIVPGEMKKIFAFSRYVHFVIFHLFNKFKLDGKYSSEYSLPRYQKGIFSMSIQTRKWIVLVMFSLCSIGSCIAGIYLFYWQRRGTPAMANVTSCQKMLKTQVCRGSWFVGEELKFGVVDNTGPEDLNQRVPVRVLGDRAIKPGLRLPIVFSVIGVGLGMLSWAFWKKEIRGQ
ncbi:MAG TPA: hypothetical protein DF383_03460 [Deltaproteobacteria bacterium]|nr:hypothetical protein [Deltaproteobacteria bacterium]